MVDFLHVRSFKNKLPEVVSLFYLNNSEVQTHILTWQVHTASAKRILLFHLLLVVVGCGRRCHLHLPTTVTHWLLHVVLLLLLHRCPWHLSVCIRTLRSLGGLQKNKYKILLLFITKKKQRIKSNTEAIQGKKTKKQCFVATTHALFLFNEDIQKGWVSSGTCFGAVCVCEVFRVFLWANSVLRIL